MAELDDLLAEIGNKYKVAFEPLMVDSTCLQILDIKDMAKYLDRLVATNAIREPLRDLPLWAKLWPGAMVLGRFLRNFEPQGKSLLELGCGMAGLSLVASRYGFARILATDVSTQALQFARANVLRNGLEHLISLRRLDLRTAAGWTEKFDRIAAAEILYLDELHRPLLKFLGRNLNEGGMAFFCTDMARLKPRFYKLAAKDFAVREGKIGIKGNERHIFSILILEKK